jgi:hypothetical protein
MDAVGQQRRTPRVGVAEVNYDESEYDNDDEMNVEIHTDPRVIMNHGHNVKCINRCEYIQHQIKCLPISVNLNILRISHEGTLWYR